MEYHKKYQHADISGQVTLQERSESYVHVSPENSAEKKPIIIRLKSIPKEVKEIVETNQVTGETTTKELRVCQVCKKGFSSGKALGGHVRIHLQPTSTKDQQLVPKKVKNETASTVSTIIGDWTSESITTATTTTKPTCPVCNKDFPSMKSLFGHLRCHPERQWRGVHPPPSFQPPSLSMVIELPKKEEEVQVNSTQETAALGLGLERDIDLLKSLSNWGATERRGRKRKQYASISVAAVAASSSSCLKEEERGEQHCDIEDICYELLAMKNKKISDTNTRISESGSSKIVLVEKEILMKPGRYACSDCNRSFSTHQALGGHRSSHSRDYRNNRAAVELLRSSLVDEGEVGSSTGQTLDQGTIEESPPREEALPGEADRTGTWVFGFDLNEVPELPDDDDDDGY